MIARVLETESRARLGETLEDIEHLLGRDVELPPELAHVGDAARAYARVADLDLARPTEGMGFVRQIGAGHRGQQRAALRTHHAEHGDARGDIGRGAVQRRVIVQVAGQPSEIAGLADRRSDDEVARLGEPRDGEVGLDAAAIVEPLRVDDAAHRHIHLAGREAVEHRTGVPALDEVLGEAGLVEERDIVAHRAALGARVLEPVLAAVGVFVLRLDAGWREPVRALPARGLAHAGARGDQAVVQRRAARAARRPVLVVRPVHRVEQPQRLDRAVAQVAAVRLERLRAPDVDIGEVHRRPSVADPIGDDLAGATARGDADRVEARRDEEVTDLGRLTDVVAVVRREALGPVEEELDAGIGEHRNATHRGLEDRLEVLGVLGQRIEAERLRDAVHAPGLGDGLEAADEQLAGVLLVVRTFVVDAQHRQVRRYALDGLGDDVEMLRGVQRDRDPRRTAELPRPHAGADDDRIRRDVTRLGVDADRPPLLDADARDLRVLEDLGAAHARAAREGLRRVDGVGLTVLADEDAADEVAHLEQRPPLADLGRREQIDLETEGLAHRGAAMELLEPRRRLRDADRAVLLEARRLPRLGLERAVELGGVLGELRQVARGAQLADETRRVPGRTAGELLAFEQDDIGDADLRQVVGDRAAGHAAADDDHVRMAGQGHRVSA